MPETDVFFVFSLRIAAMDCSTSNTTIKTKAPQPHLRRRSYSSCHGVQVRTHPLLSLARAQTNLFSVPDTAQIKKKMLYSSSFDALKRSLVGVTKYIQATDLSEASKESVEEKLRSTDRV